MDNQKVVQVKQIFDKLGLQNITPKLIELGYFDAPASRGNHHGYVGGLVDHSLQVMSNLLSYTNNEELEWEDSRSPFIIALLHDLCKVDDYVYDEENKVFKHNINKKYGNGHGDKSVKIIEEVLELELTDEESMCIQYHMGPFSTNEEYWRIYQNAVNEYPNILWTHQADIISGWLMK